MTCNPAKFKRVQSMVVVGKVVTKMTADILMKRQNGQ